jgi:hypothetical protein
MRSILTYACLILAALSTAAEEWPPDELSRTAIARNQETFARLSPCALEMTWKRDPADQKPATAILKYKGTWVFADWERPGRQDPFGNRIRAVLNDAYFAFTLGDLSAIAYQYESDGGPKATEIILKVARAHLPHNPMTFAFGNGSQTLKEAMEGYRKAFACVAQEVTDNSGRRVVRMKVYPNKDSGPSDARWVYDFDPARGFAITRLAAMSGSQPFIENKVELQPGELPETWLPRHVWRYAYTPNSHAEEFEVKILPGADLSDAAFRTTALNLPSNQIVARMPPDGAPGSSVVPVDGVWLPDRYAGRLGATVRTAPRVGAVGPKRPALLAAAIFVTGMALFIWAAGSARKSRRESAQ